MFKFMSSSEPYKYHVGLPPALRFLSLMESHHKTRELLAKDLAESGQCANDLLRKVIFPQIQDSGVPTHSSTNTPQMHPTVNQPGLPALGYYAHGNSPCKRVLCSEDDDDAGNPQKRVCRDGPGKNADEHHKCANYDVDHEDAGDHRRHVRWSQGYEGNKEAASYHGIARRGRQVLGSSSHTWPPL